MISRWCNDDSTITDGECNNSSLDNISKEQKDTASNSSLSSFETDSNLSRTKRMDRKQKKGKKKKKKKGKKKGKKGKKKKLKLYGAKYIKDMEPYDMLVELVKNGIIKKLPPTSLPDFIGEFNYIHLMIDDIKDTPREPSMALIRQLVTEYIIFPLGSALVRARFPEMIRSFLFYGPAGTGKTQVVRAIATETRSVIYDLSPLSIEGVFNNPRSEGDKLVAMVMIAAKEF